MLAQWVRDGEVTAHALLAMAVARSHALQSATGSMSQWVDSLGQASLARMDRAAPLAGVPFLVKDLGSPLAGAVDQAGSCHLARYGTPSPHDGELIARLKIGGLVPFGKTTVPEFGLSLVSEPAIGCSSSGGHCPDSPCHRRGWLDPRARCGLRRVGP